MRSTERERSLYTTRWCPMQFFFIVYILKLCITNYLLAPLPKALLQIAVAGQNSWVMIIGRPLILEYSAVEQMLTLRASPPSCNQIQHRNDFFHTKTPLQNPTKKKKNGTFIWLTKHTKDKTILAKEDQASGYTATMVPEPCIWLVWSHPQMWSLNFRPMTTRKNNSVACWAPGSGTAVEMYVTMSVLPQITLRLNNLRNLWQPKVGAPQRRQQWRSLIFFAGTSTTDRQDRSVRQPDTPASATPFIATSWPLPTYGEHRILNTQVEDALRAER